MCFGGFSPGTSASSLTIIDTSVRAQCNCHMVMCIVTRGWLFKSGLAQLWVKVTFEGDFIAACLYCKFKSANPALNNSSQKFNKKILKTVHSEYVSVTFSTFYKPASRDCVVLRAVQDSRPSSEAGKQNYYNK